MKKIFLLLVMTSFVATTWAQQLSTIRGKTKDNKTLTVQYYPGSFEDRIESVKYQVVDELQNNIKTLQNNVKDLQNRLDAANTQIKQFNNDLKTSTKKNQNDQALNQQLAAKEAEIVQLTSQIDSLSSLIEQASIEKYFLESQIDSITEAMQEKDFRTPTVESTPVVGIEFGFGPTLMNSGLSEPWVKNTTWNKQLAVYFGTARFTESLPLSFEVGIGINQLPVSACIYQYSTQIAGWEDLDGDICTAHYSFDDLNEKLTTTSIGIPIRLCIGQPMKDKVSVYAKLGVTPSFILSSKFTKSGRYTLAGYYPNWDVTLEDIAELGFNTNHEFDGSPIKVNASSKFNLWGNLALGAYIPVSFSVLVNAGVKMDYPLLGSNSFTAADESNLNILGWKGLLDNPQKTLTASFEIGLVYTLR